MTRAPLSELYHQGSSSYWQCITRQRITRQRITRQRFKQQRFTRQRITQQDLQLNNQAVSTFGGFRKLKP